MKFCKFLTLAAAFAGLLCSCQKQTGTCSVDIKVTLGVSDDLNAYTDRSYSIYQNGQWLMTYRVEGANFSDTKSVTNITPPARLDIVLFGAAKSEGLPASIVAQYSREIGLISGNNSIYDRDNSLTETVERDSISAYVEKNLCDTLSFSLNSDGTLSKIQ